jgi:hypothetical protein
MVMVIQDEDNIERVRVVGLDRLDESQTKWIQPEQQIWTPSHIGIFQFVEMYIYKFVEMVFLVLIFKI